MTSHRQHPPSVHPCANRTGTNSLAPGRAILPLLRLAALTVLLCGFGLVGGCAMPGDNAHQTYEGNSARLSDLVPPPPPNGLSGFGRTR